MTAVGASYAFDPRSDGIAGIYATRVLERGIDPRALCAEIRADRDGAPDRGAARRAMLARARVSRFGRGTAAHLTAIVDLPTPVKATPSRGPKRAIAPARGQQRPELRLSRRLAAAGIALLLLLPLSVIAAHAQDASPQARYIVQEGDTLDSVAAEFGVDPQAIVAASAIQHPPYLTPREIIVIPATGESPDAAARTASYFQGASPFVVGAHDVAAGETLGDIAATRGLDALTLAAFNGISDIDSLDAGQRLRIPLTDSVTKPGVAPTVGDAAGSDAWDTPARGPVFAVEAPAYMQAYSLSCEYAAAYIATAGLGNGVPESAFIESIPLSQNPHWGYRGVITEDWGGTDNYGVYPEAMAPTLNDYGFATDIFYGTDASSLTARLDAGMPVLTWLGYFGDNAWLQEDEGSYLLAPGMHVVTVYGYDDGGVYLVNPGRGTHDHYGWDDFLAMWRVLDGMAMAVAPIA
jgi:uncharacterized protein YvpB/LysM repeat protein